MLLFPSNGPRVQLVRRSFSEGGCPLPAARCLLAPDSCLLNSDLLGLASNRAGLALRLMPCALRLLLYAPCPMLLFASAEAKPPGRRPLTSPVRWDKMHYG
jgi:hypothetical protein